MKFAIGVVIPAFMFVLPTGALADEHAAAGNDVPQYVTSAMADPARGDDTKDDERRRMAAVMAFSQVKPGDKVAELVPGEDYWTVVFSQIVGDDGHVYTIWPNEALKYSGKGLARLAELSQMPRFSNITVLKQPAADFNVPEKVDLVFTAQNYHDYHDPFMGPVDMEAFNRKIFDALKPGGTYVVIDHVAPEGSGLDATDTLHRIDPEVVKEEVESAGFVFDGESNALRNPDDPHDIKVFDPSIRGHTDQFIYRFKKPAE